MFSVGECTLFEQCLLHEEKESEQIRRKRKTAERQIIQGGMKELEMV